MCSRYGNTHKQLQKQLTHYQNEWNQHFWNEFVLPNKDKLKWSTLSYNENITMEIIEANLDKPWDYHWLSFNPNITWDFIEANLDKPWNWDILSRNENITMDIVSKNMDKPWSWNWLSYNPNITWDFIEANLDNYGIGLGYHIDQILLWK